MRGHGSVASILPLILSIGYPRCVVRRSTAEPDRLMVVYPVSQAELWSERHVSLSSFGLIPTIIL